MRARRESMGSTRSPIGIWSALLEYLLVVALCGGLLTLALLAYRRWPLPTAWAKFAWLGTLHAKDRGVPYGVAIALGAFILFPSLPVVVGTGQG